MLRKISSLLILSGFTLTAFAQDRLQVLILDETGTQVPGVQIALKDKQGSPLTQSISDENGVAEVEVMQYPAIVAIEDMLFEAQAKTVYAKSEHKIVLNTQKKLSGINEVIVTGVGRPTRLDEAVSSYRIINATDIKGMGAVSLNDALRNQLGVNISQDAMLGSQANMRGLSGNNIKILIDGLPVNGREGGNVDLSQLNLANIERIEIVQGPMNVMYGSDGIGGIYNLITKTNNKSKAIGANAFYESMGRYNFSLDASKSWGKHNISLMGARNFTQGWDPLYDTLRNPLWKPKEQYIGNLKYTYRFNDFASMTYGMDLTAEELTIKGGMDEFSVFNPHATDMYFNTTRWANRLQFRWRTGKDGYWESNNSYALYHRKRTTYLTNLNTLERELATGTGDQNTTRFDNVSSRTSYNNKTGIFNYTFGYDVNLEYALAEQKLTAGKKFIGDYALFLTSDIHVSNQLTLQPAVRFIHNTAYNAPVSPSFGIMYKAAEQMRIRASYSRGFRAPTLKELYLNFVDLNHTILGNPDLKAEYSNHFQLSTAYTFFEQDRKYLTSSITAFYDDVKDQIAISSAASILEKYKHLIPHENLQSPYITSNIGRSRLLVLQLSNDFSYNNLKASLGASYTKSFATESYGGGEANILYKTPDFHYFEINGSVRYAITKWKMGLSGFYKLTGSQPILGMIEGGSIFGEDYTRAYHNIDLSIDKFFWKDRIQLIAGVRNLTDNTIIGYTTATGIGGSGNAGHTTGSGLNLSIGRTIFTSLRIQLSKS
jgi:outer membrane receptor for ferrienterochelin and colicins